MPLPTLAEFSGLVPPVFLRVLNSEADWGHPDDEPGSRIKVAVENGFLRRHKSPFSFYQIADDNDLRRVLMGLTGNRHDPFGKVIVVAFPLDELHTLNGRIEQTLGRTKCAFANKRHWDWTANEDLVNALCRNAMAAGRAAFRIAKPVMKLVVEAAQSERCAATPLVVELCLVDECAVE